MKAEWTLKEISEWAKDNSEVKIPAIQRGLVWKPHQVELLWDSILRQFPIGAFMLSYKNKVYSLIDGQQRWNAIASGYTSCENHNEIDKNCILWFDLMPENAWKGGNSTRKYFIRVTTKAHPWGYKADDKCTTLNTQEKKNALKTFGVDHDKYEGEISLAKTYPVESGLPIPLGWMIAAGEEYSEDRDSFAKFIMDKIEENQSSRQVFKLKRVDEINSSLIAKYHDVFSRLSCYKVPTIYIDQETIDKESGNKGDDGALSGIEILFNRIGTGGTRITESELMYSAIKAYWPELTEENNRLAKDYMPPHTLISLAFRLVLSTGDKGFKRTLSVREIRQLALNENENIRIQIDKLYDTKNRDGSVMKRILSIVNKWLTDMKADGKRQIHPILRTSIARNSPDVYLLLMAFAKWQEEGQIEPTPKEETLFRATAFYLHWMVGDKFEAANLIFKTVANNPLSEWKNVIKQILLKLCVKGAVTPLLSPEAFENLFTIEKNKNWRPGGNGRSSMPWWPLWKIVTSKREILLYAQRKYMCLKFPNYDPAREDLWEGHNRPWDFDHIIPQNWIHKPRSWRQTFTDYCEAWKDNNGNMAAIPFWVNRAKSDEANWDEYSKNSASLLADREISNFSELFNARKLNCNADQAKCFAEKTFVRMCKIYNEVYALLEPVDFRIGGITFPEKGGIKDRKERMTAICDILVNNSFTAGIYYLYGNMEYPHQGYIDDWTKDWMSCGCITKNKYYAAFTMRLYSDGSIGDKIEIGLRRLPQTAERIGKVTEEQLQQLNRQLCLADGKTYKLYEDNPWWHIYKEINIDTENGLIINELKELAKFASQL